MEFKVHFALPTGETGFFYGSAENLDAYTAALARTVRGEGFVVGTDRAVPAKYITYVEEVAE